MLPRRAAEVDGRREESEKHAHVQLKLRARTLSVLCTGGPELRLERWMQQRQVASVVKPATMGRPLA
jgi:hypothetical protein